jgi:hypothetical protein
MTLAARSAQKADRAGRTVNSPRSTVPKQARTLGRYFRCWRSRLSIKRLLPAAASLYSCLWIEVEKQGGVTLGRQPSLHFRADALSALLWLMNMAGGRAVPLQRLQRASGVAGLAKDRWDSQQSCHRDTKFRQYEAFFRGPQGSFATPQSTPVWRLWLHRG